MKREDKIHWFYAFTAKNWVFVGHWECTFNGPGMWGMMQGVPGHNVDSFRQQLPAPPGGVQSTDVTVKNWVFVGRWECNLHIALQYNDATSHCPCNFHPLTLPMPIQETTAMVLDHGSGPLPMQNTTACAALMQE